MVQALKTYVTRQMLAVCLSASVDATGCNCLGPNVKNSVAVYTLWFFSED